MWLPALPTLLAGGGSWSGCWVGMSLAEFAQPQCQARLDTAAVPGFAAPQQPM